MLRAPSRVEIAEAVAAGVETRLGLPVEVAMGGDTIATLNLAAFGSPDPWVVTTILGEGTVVDMATSSDRGVYIGGLAVDGADIGLVDAAMRAGRMLPGDRHSAESDVRRMEAGRYAMRITDAMVRARVLDVVDGWSAMMDAGHVIDQSDAGLLVTPPAEMETDCRLLLVVCPSTGRRYVIRVPSEMTTAEEARLWSFGDGWEAAPEVET